MSEGGVIPQIKFVLWTYDAFLYGTNKVRVSPYPPYSVIDQGCSGVKPGNNLTWWLNFVLFHWLPKWFCLIVFDVTLSLFKTATLSNLRPLRSKDSLFIKGSNPGVRYLKRKHIWVLGIYIFLATNTLIDYTKIDRTEGSHHRNWYNNIEHHFARSNFDPIFRSASRLTALRILSGTCGLWSLDTSGMSWVEELIP